MCKWNKWKTIVSLMSILLFVGPLAYNILYLSDNAVLPRNRVSVAIDPYQVIHSLSSKSLSLFTEASSNSLVTGTTGKHGFVQKLSDGHFYFEDKTRARFWGVNLVSNAINLDRDTIDNLTTELAKNGVNMIRLHLIDSNYMASLIDYSSGNSSNLNPEMLDKVDYLIAKCGEKGIYIYLDLLDARSFLESEDIVNGSLLKPQAKIVSIFNDTLIAMQKQYATNLFTHVNPYTKKTYAQDPTIALVEITNENGMIWNPYGGGTGWRDIPEPYQSELKEKWNNWLLEKYGSRSELDAAWTSSTGEHALKSYEDPASGTVELPDVVNGWAYTIYSRNYTDPVLGYPRVNDGSLFAYELLKNYFSTMKNHLRSLGVKVPIGASDDQWEVIPPTQRAIKEVLDFSAAGYYYDHPHASADKIAIFSNTPELYTTSDAIAPVVASQKIAGVPIVVREWNFPFPNDYRSEGPIQMAVFACLQDWDAVILHDLGESYWDLQPNKELVWWPSHNDPARWPQIRAGANIFLRQLIKPLELEIDIGYSFTDTFFAQYGYHQWQYSVAPYLGRTQNYFFDFKYDGSADVVISSGRTSNASYILASHEVIVAPMQGYLDLHCKSKDISYMATQIYSSIEVNMMGAPGSGDFSDFAYDSKTVNWGWDEYYPVKISILPSGAKPFGNSTDDVWAAGFLTSRALIMVSSDKKETTKTLVHDYDYHPKTGGDHNIFEVYSVDSLSVRLVVDAFKSWGLTTLSRADVSDKMWHDEENTWIRDYGNGIFKLNISEARAVVGFCEGNTTLGDVTFKVETHHAAVSLVSLDDKPLNESGHMLFVSVANAWNTNQNVTLTYNATGNYAYSWIKSWHDVGTAPVLYETFKSTVYLPENISGVLFLEDLFGNIKSTPLVSNRSVFYIYTASAGSNITSMEIIEDTSSPVIYSVSPEEWTPEYNESTKILVNVTDTESGLMNVSLIYTQDENTWNVIPMYSTLSGLWEGILPAHPYDTVVKFYIYAEDYANHSTVENNNSAYFQIRSIDSYPPELLSVSWSPQNPIVNQSITITCDIQDNGSGVDSVLLMYKINEGGYSHYDMQLSNGHYVSTIPALKNSGTIYFYLIVSDKAGNMETLKNGSTDWSIIVSSGSTPSTQESPFDLIQNNLILLLGGLGVIVVVIVLLAKRKR